MASLTAKLTRIERVMPIFYSINPKKKIVISVGSGVLTLAETFLHQRLLRNDKHFDHKFSHLIDLTGVLNFEVDAGEAKSLARKEPFSSASRLALLAFAPMMLKITQLIYEAYRWEGKEVKAFFKRSEAMKWLSSRQRKSRLPTQRKARSDSE
jgi:hypothetical protein